MERIFSLDIILTNLKRCHLQSQKLENLIFVNKNWFNDPKIGCKPPFNMVEFHEIDVDSFKEFEIFKQALERDEVVEVKIIYKKTLLQFFLLLFNMNKIFIFNE
jgi:hypothetical protein